MLLSATEDLPVKSPSVVTRREAALYGIAYHLEARYIYDDSGNFARNYSPASYPRTNRQLHACVSYGLAIFQELKDLGFEDETLRGALGIATASLVRDEAMQLPEAFALHDLRPLQVFRDALDAALVELSRSPQHSKNVVETICRQMASRDLGSDDDMLLPKTKEALDALLKIVAADLEAIGPR